MSQGDGSLGVSTPNTFDFSAQSGVLLVMSAIRLADITPAQRNELKDLVFSYSNGGRDEAVKNILESRLESLHITPELVASAKAAAAATLAKSQIPANGPGFSVGRPAPVFAPASVAIVSESKPVIPVINNSSVTEVVKSTPITVPNPTPTVTVPKDIAPAPSAEVLKDVVPEVLPQNIPAPTQSVVVAPTAAPAASEVVTAPVEKVAPVTATAKISPIIPVPDFNTAVSTPVVAQKNVSDLDNKPAPVVVPEPVPAVITPAAAPVADASSSSDSILAQARLERIRVIKSDVNGRVGNPVNLVDIDNTIGREYMSALLEAMKLLSSAPQAESERVMSRLESVYKQVLALLNVSNTPNVAAATPQVESVVALTPQVTAPQVIPSIPVVDAPVSNPVITRVLPIARAEVAPVVLSESESTFAARSKVVDTASAAETSVWSNSAPVVNAVEPVMSVAQRVEVRPEVVEARIVTPPAEPIRVAPVPPVPPQTERVSSVPESVPPLRAITELPTAAEVSASEAVGNPLFTKDVDDGLEQLLGEWSIFKKSGLFGTGPKGRQHPLYQKIAPLQIPFILSGRFEGSSQEIKQSITDYMNGWRYEQGIVYEQEETFDIYLRRVIRHIIDLQNKKRRS